MDTSANRPASSKSLALGAVVVTGCLTGIGAATQPGHVAPDQPRSVAAASATGRCDYCGVVENIREISSSEPRYAVSTVAGGRDQVIVMLLSALGGTRASAVRAKIYEVSVRMDDGSIRAVRDAGRPQWKTGDRVKVVKGRVEWLS
jgi:hypothetical protein